MLRKSVKAVVLIFLAAASCLAAGFAVHDVDYAGVTYKIFTAKPETVSLLWQNTAGENHGKLRAAAKAVKEQGKTPLMLMNAGIFGTDGAPAGLWIENGRELHAINLKKGKGLGNFHIQPNGVLWIAGKKAGILTTGAWQKKPVKADYAVQSGPMLLIAGKINSRFVKNLSSPYTRNAVCTLKSGELAFIITTDYAAGSEWPSFYRLAEALKHFGCIDALYLDGSISAYYQPGENTGFHWKPFAGIIAVSSE